MASTLVQDPRKQEAILDASIRVFAEHGFGKTDVQLIADAAGVGKGTIYRYFGSKEELFLATADAVMKALEAHCYQETEGMDDPIEVLRVAGRAYAQFFQDRPEMVEILILERAEFRGAIPDTHMVYRAKNRGMAHDLFQKGIDQGVFRSLDVSEMAEVFLNLLYGTIVCGCLQGESQRLVPMVETAVELLLDGIRSDGLEPGKGQ